MHDGQDAYFGAWKRCRSAPLDRRRPADRVNCRTSIAVLPRNYPESLRRMSGTRRWPPDGMPRYVRIPAHVHLCGLTTKHAELRHPYRLCKRGFRVAGSIDTDIQRPSVYQPTLLIARLAPFRRHVEVHRWFRHARVNHCGALDSSTSTYVAINARPTIDGDQFRSRLTEAKRCLVDVLRTDPRDGHGSPTRARQFRFCKIPAHPVERSASVLTTTCWGERP